MSAELVQVCLQIFSVVGVGLFCSILLESLLKPRPRIFYRRDWGSIGLHIGTWLVLFAAELLLFRRPWFAMANVLAIQVFMILVNNAKYHSLREAFICQDFEYFADLIKHPLLYIPFFGVARTLVVAIMFIGVLIVGMMLEPSPLNKGNWSVYGLAWLLLCLVGAGLLYFPLKGSPALTLEPNKDIEQMGQAAFLWRYGLQAIRQKELPDEMPFSRPECVGLPRVKNELSLPTLVAVQSESFFDVRNQFPFVKKTLLENYDRIVHESSCSGRLSVPAWGANTVRSECGFLTGAKSDSFGVHQFNPYRYLRHYPVDTIASYLKSLGYRTVCIHPYPKSFYLRDAVYPDMGFDEFIDDAEFLESDKEFQYVGDMAVARKVEEVTHKHRGQPLFIFVITMENHGPLHLEAVEPDEKNQFFSSEQPDSMRDLVAYCRHLRNADAMINSLCETLKKSPNGGGLCWYGDHVPIMADVYKTYDVPDGNTDYLIWSSLNPKNDNSRPAEDLNIDQLAVRFLQSVLPT